MGLGFLSAFTGSGGLSQSAKSGARGSQETGPVTITTGGGAAGNIAPWLIGGGVALAAAWLIAKR